MRAERLAYEPAVAGWSVRRVLEMRPRASRGPHRRNGAVLGSAIIHALLVVALLLMRPGAPPGEDQSAPSFAVEFDPGALQAATRPTATSEPRVSLGGSDVPPPEEASPTAEPLPPPLPRPQYGTALRPKANQNPFARLVPFDLTQRQTPRASPFGRAGVHGLDLNAGPEVREGKITDSITHPPGAEVSGDYDLVIRAFVEAHREQIQDSLRDVEAGQAVLQVTISRDGRVRRLHLLKPSGSALLDAAWVSFFRSYALPPLTSDIRGDEYTFAYELDYSIIYGPPPR